MDYEKKYNEALERAREIKSKILLSHLSTESCKAVSEYIDEIIPELRESEDERIRKGLLRHFKNKTKPYWNEIAVKDIIAYLEKQKDKMTAEEFESSELFQLKLKTKYANGYQDGLAQKDQKPAELEQEDEHRRKDAIYFLESAMRHYADTSEIEKTIAWLEKQKINTEGDFGRGYDCGYQAGYAVAMNEMKPKVATVTLDSEKQKEQKQILEVFGFKVGDKVRLKDGDGRTHIIKKFEKIEGVHGPDFYQVEFEDNSARDGIYPGEEYPNGYYTQMEKIKEEPKPAEWSQGRSV